MDKRRPCGHHVAAPYEPCCLERMTYFDRRRAELRYCHTSSLHLARMLRDRPGNVMIALTAAALHRRELEALYRTCF